jgi:hypothetical protein
VARLALDLYYGRAVIFEQLEGEMHGGSRRSVEGAGARTQPLGPSYYDHRSIGWEERYRRTSERKEGYTDTVNGGAPENLACTKGTMGEDERHDIHTGAHSEPICEKKDRCRTARTLGEVEDAAEEGGVTLLRSDTKRKRAEVVLPLSCCFCLR